MTSDEPRSVAVERDARGEPAGPAERTAVDCFRAGVEAALPRAVIGRAVSVDGDTLRIADDGYDLAAYDRLVVVGGGKAADGVATALASALGDRIDAGVVVVDGGGDPGGQDEQDEPDGQAGADPTGADARIDRVYGGHPVPTEGSVAGGTRVLDLVADAGAETLVIAVVTGGASALLAAPAAGVDLDALRTTTSALLDAGAEIHEINAVRKHLSRVKGGRLAAAAAPATVAGLAFSDVVDNDLGVIGSGPTAPDDTGFADALATLDRYDPSGDRVPGSVRDRLERGARGEVEGTPAAGSSVFERVRTRVLADGLTALDAAAAVARERGYEPLVLSGRLRGEAADSGLTHAGVAEGIAASGTPLRPPAVVLSGGETTVTVTGDGEGGPNLACALAAGVEFASSGSPLRDRECAFLAADTDGRDGSTAYAGAVVGPDTVGDRSAARDALDDDDALGFLEGTGALLSTGATGTNVNDFRVIVVAE